MLLTFFIAGKYVLIQQIPERLPQIVNSPELQQRELVRTRPDRGIILHLVNLSFRFSNQIKHTNLTRIQF